MIDSLSPAVMPLPTKSAMASSAPGTPSFLQWTLMTPGHSSGDDPSDPGFQQRDIADAQVPTVIDADADTLLFAATQTLIVQNGHELLQTPDLTPLADPTQQIDGLPLPGLTRPPGRTPHIDDGQTSVSVVQLNPTLEFHVRNLQGEREVVALPWRLIASGRLAQSLDGHTGAGVPGGALSSSDSTSMVTTIASLAQSGTSGMAVVDTLTDTLSARGVLLPPTNMTPLHMAADAEAIAPAASAPASSAAVEWLARWVRWIERDGHDPAIWLRDFRIDDDEARRVVDDLRTLAREHGISLERIVVNGREHWRNAHTASFKE